MHKVCTRNYIYVLLWQYSGNVFVSFCVELNLKAKRVNEYLTMLKQITELEYGGRK